MSDDDLDQLRFDLLAIEHALARLEARTTPRPHDSERADR